MNSTTTFVVGITIQALLAIGQILAVILFVYRWSKNSWRFSNLMKIREPLARAYCSLSSIARIRKRLAGEPADQAVANHDRERILKVTTMAQDEILDFSVEHFKAKFWLRGAENTQLDVLFDKLSSVLLGLRKEKGTDQEVDAALNDLRKEILAFDALCGLVNYNGGNWSHVAPKFETA
jgi:hypothetical protein